MISESRERFGRKVRKLSEKLKILRFPGDVVSIRGGRKIPDLPLFEVLARVPEKSEKCRKSEISGPRTRFCRSRNPGNPDIFRVAILPRDLAPVFPGFWKFPENVRKSPKMTIFGRPKSGFWSPQGVSNRFPLQNVN